MIPRYLYSEAMLKTCSLYLKLKFVFCCLVGLKCTILVLSVFTLGRRVERQLKTRFSKFCSCSSVSAIITRSSAYNKEFMCTPLRSNFGPYYFKCIAKSLIYKQNSVGDKQSLCRTPQTFSNHSERSDPFISIHDKVLVRSVFIDLYIQQFVQKKLSVDPIESFFHIDECAVCSFVFSETISDNSCGGIYMILTRPILRKPFCSSGKIPIKLQYFIILLFSILEYALDTHKSRLIPR